MPRLNSRGLLLLLSLCLPFATIGIRTSAAETTGNTTNTTMVDLGEGRLQMGSVTLDTKEKSLTFPAVINMTNGLVEYLIVTSTGKVHESLLRTDAEPFHVHTAMLILGAKSDTNSDPAIFFDAQREIPGSRLQIEVILPGKSPQPIQSFLAHAQTKNRVEESEIPYWVYNGSRFSESPLLAQEAKPSASQRIFLAQRDGSIVSLIADPAALVNNSRKDRENDELWHLHTPVIPPADTKVAVRFKLETPKP